MVRCSVALCSPRSDIAAYIQHDVDRAIIIDFDLHHGNGTQALVMPLNAASYAEDLAMAAGKPPSDMRGLKGPRRGWKGFYGSVHDIYSYPCEVRILTTL